MSQRIKINIDKIRLDGYEHVDVKKLKAQIEEHLALLLTQKGIPKSKQQTTRLDRLQGGQITCRQGDGTIETGKGIAESIFQAITGGNQGV